MLRRPLIPGSAGFRVAGNLTGSAVCECAGEGELHPGGSAGAFGQVITPVARRPEASAVKLTVSPPIPMEFGLTSDRPAGCLCAGHPRCLYEAGHLWPQQSTISHNQSRTGCMQLSRSYASCAASSSADTCVRRLSYGENLSLQSDCRLRT
jgi:hypothetical protein